MKKTVFIIVILVVCIFACFADVSRWASYFYVDEFGDPTDTPYIRSETIRLKYGNYDWDVAHCSICIDFDSVGLILNDRVYGDWVIKTKTEDGTTHSFKGKRASNGTILIIDNTAYNLPATLVIDLVKGCRLIAYPDNKYSNDKYDFGKVKLPLEELQKVRPNWT